MQKKKSCNIFLAQLNYCFFLVSRFPYFSDSTGWFLRLSRPDSILVQISGSISDPQALKSRKKIQKKYFPLSSQKNTLGVTILIFSPATFSKSSFLFQWMAGERGKETQVLYPISISQLLLILLILLNQDMRSFCFYIPDCISQSNGRPLSYR